MDPSRLSTGSKGVNRGKERDLGIGSSTGRNMGDLVARTSSRVPQVGSKGKSPVKGDYNSEDVIEGNGDSEKEGDEDDLALPSEEGGHGRGRKLSAGENEQHRVQLACFYCRNKRIRCSGEKPICSACIKANTACEWPSGRRRKRTRKEMEEAKRLQAVNAESIAQAEQSHMPIHNQSQGRNQLMGQSPIQIQGLGERQMGGTQSSQQDQGVRPSMFSLNSQADVGVAGSSNASNINMVNPMGMASMGLPGFSGGGLIGEGFDSMFNIDGNGSYSTDLSSAAFNPSDFWNFPTPPSISMPNTTNALAPTTQPMSTNYVWPTGFTPENASIPTFNSGLSDKSGVPEPTMAQFMTNHSPATDVRLITALENQAAFIEGNPDKDKDLELFYYRFAGSTAIQPGIHRISLKLQRRSNAGESPLNAAPHPERDDQDPPIVIGSQISRNPSDMFDGNGMPLLSVWQPLFELFLANMSQHFPSVSRQRMTERYETGTMSNFLANCICACGARFSANAKDRQASACAPFIAKAQELIIPLVHLPTTETTTGLIFLSWANFGQNSESGLWQYSGMAIRMAIDIGIHENSDLYESPAHIIRTRLLFWTLFVTDRIVAFATGRPASISEDIVEVPLPEDTDFFPDPSRNTPGYPPEKVEPVPFVYFVRLMIICGRISNVLNGRRGRNRTLVSTAEPLAEQLAELQMRLVQFVAGLPESLRWSADSFKHQHNRGHGGCFLALHLWAHAVLALIYHPELLKSPSGVETPLNKGMSRNVKLSLASSRQICECMVFADLVAPSCYTSTPFLVQPLFVAAMAIIHEMRAVQVAQTTGNASDIFLISMAKQNLTALLNAISRMEQYWAGASYVATVLEKRSGLKATSHSGRRTLISLPDLGLLKRFTTDKDDPRDLAPATETSLRESIAKSERNNPSPSPYWLADLMAGYTVENMSFTPADSLDLERLLAGSLSGGGFGIEGVSGEDMHGGGVGAMNFGQGVN